ncbi:MAG: hypothetical protein ABIZ91_02300 [Gemmatimonadaceae bacterium]
MSTSPQVRAPFRALAPWLIGSAALPAVIMASAMEFLPLLNLTMEVLAAVLLAALVAGAVRARARLLSRPYIVLVPVLMLLSVGAATAFPLIDGTLPRNFAVFGSAAPTLMGWAIFFWLLGTRERDGDAAWIDWEPPRWALPVLLLSSVVLLAVVHWASVGRWAVVSDEVIYLLQSKWIWNSDYAWHVDPELVPFFSMRKLGMTPGGGLYGMYTPGWPALLALFDAVGLRWWSGVILGTISVWATFRIGALLYSRAAGLLGALLLLIQPWFVIMHAGYMAHAATICGIALSALWLLESERASSRGRVWRWLAVGVALAVAVTVRTLTGVALGASLGLWLVVRRNLSFGEVVRCALTVVAGALPLAAWFFHYNWATNGEPLRISYQAMYGDGYNMGFGIRGFTGFNEQMQRVMLPIRFTPRDAVSHLLQRIAGINLAFVPYALFAPILVIFAAHRHRPRWPVVAVFFILPVLYFFYWGSEIRFYTEYLPFLTVWVAAGCLAIMRERPRLGASFLAAIVGSSMLLNIPGRWSRIPLDEPWIRSGYTGSPARFAAFESLDSLQQARGKLLVFVRERGTLYDVVIDRLYQFNADGLESPILVVRDLGEKNALAVEHFADRVPVLFEDNGREKAATISVLPRP